MSSVPEHYHRGLARTITFLANNGNLPLLYIIAACIRNVLQNYLFFSHTFSVKSSAGCFAVPHYFSLMCNIIN